MAAARPATVSELKAKAEALVAAAPIVDAGEAPNVIEALRRVMRDLPAIGKDNQASQQQGGYNYRGIEKITPHTQALFAKHCVIFIPRVVGYEIRDIVVNGKPWTDTIEQVEYDVFGPGGIEDKIVVGPILAIGRDNSDKGANKCLTQAYKYALLQALSISDAKDDGDGSTHEADAATRPTISPKTLAKSTLLDLVFGDKEKAATVWAAIGGDDEVWSSDPVKDVTDRYEAWVNEPPAELQEQS